MLVYILGWMADGASNTNLYKVLGIKPSASDNEIKVAHRNLAKKYHPDRNLKNQATAAEKFKTVQEAYEVLSNPEKRKLYDSYGEEGLRASAQGGGGAGGYPGRASAGFNGMHSDFESGDAAEMLFEMFGRRGSRGFSGSSSQHGFGNMFSQMFGMDMEDSFSDDRFHQQQSGRQRSDQQQPPETVRVEVSLEELYVGKTKPITVEHRIRVPGSGALYSLKHTYKLQLKPTWKEGTTVRFPSILASLSQGGSITIPPVLMKVTTKPHKSYERVGDNLIMIVKLKRKQALKRLKLRIPLLDGTFLTFETRGRVTHGSLQEFPNRGMPINKDGTLTHGKLFVKFVITPDGPEVDM